MRIRPESICGTWNPRPPTPGYSRVPPSTRCSCQPPSKTCASRSWRHTSLRRRKPMNDDLMDGDVVVDPPPRRVVKKKGKKRVATPRVQHAEANVTRNSPRPAPRAEPTREPAREMARETTRRGAVVAIGHGGEKLTRRRTTVGDAFEVPKNEIPSGWSYQWNTVTVLNKETKDIERGDLLMHENGWRPGAAYRPPGGGAAAGF